MAKKFMFCCIGILALVVAFHLGAQYGQAGYVDHTTTGIIALINDSGSIVLLDNGEMWVYTDDATGWQIYASTLPVPVSEAKFVGSSHYVDYDNQLWLREGPEWVNKGTPPGLVATEPTTWGAIKAEFKD